MADIASIVEQVAAELGGQCIAEEDGTWSLTVLGEDEDEVVALVTLYADKVDDGPAEGTELLMIRAAAGELDESIETFLAEEASGTWFARVYLEDDEEASRPVIIVEAGLPTEGLTQAVANHAVLEVIDLIVNAQDFVLEADDEE